MFFRTLRQILRTQSTRAKLLANVKRRCICTTTYGLGLNVATQLLFVLVGSTAECRANELMEGEREPRPKRKRKISKEAYKMTFEGKAQHYLNALKVRWMQLHEIPGIFAYQLNVKQTRFLSGKHTFYVELNEDRTLNRRAPLAIETLTPKFKPKQFNFNKVDALEVMLTIDYAQSEIQMIVNKSPITKFHTLICPDVRNNLVQRITPESLGFCVHFLRSINDEDIRIGYNSPGALASVNHLHYHLVHMPNNLYIDNVELEELAGGYAYRLSPSMPTEAVCISFDAKDEKEVLEEKLKKLNIFTDWLVSNNLPHNLFITYDRRKGKRGNVLVFVFARCKYCVNKDLNVFNVGFCELAGYIPVGDASRMQNLTENVVIDRIREVTGTAYNGIYQQLANIINNEPPSPWTIPFI